MSLLLSVFYITWFTYHSIRRFAPCFLAVSGDIPYTDARVRRASKVSVAYIVGVIVYTVAWAMVLSTTLTLMY